ncbi:MAG: hypothetical protein PHE93_01800 [Clostridia bacterium]|nr:hypothetical protein [Clostridia bacterium]
MSLLDKIYQAISNFSGNFPAIDTSLLYAILLSAIAFLAVVCGLIFLSTGCYKMQKWSKKIIKYLAMIPSISEENEAYFTKECFGSKCPKNLKESWQSFLNVRFGYPSEIVSENKVFETERKFSSYPMFLFGTLSLIVIVVIGIMLTSAVALNTLFVGMLIAFAFAVCLEIVLYFAYRFQQKVALTAFRDMQDELDAKILLQNMKEFVADTAGLSEIANELEKIIAKIERVKIPDNYEDLVGDEVEAELVFEAEEIPQSQLKAEEIPQSQLKAEVMPKPMSKVEDKTAAVDEPLAATVQNPTILRNNELSKGAGSKELEAEIIPNEEIEKETTPKEEILKEIEVTAEVVEASDENVSEEKNERIDENLLKVGQDKTDEVSDEEELVAEIEQEEPEEITDKATDNAEIEIAEVEIDKIENETTAKTVETSAPKETTESKEIAAPEEITDAVIEEEETEAIEEALEAEIVEAEIETIAEEEIAQISETETEHNEIDSNVVVADIAEIEELEEVGVSDDNDAVVTKNKNDATQTNVVAETKEIENIEETNTNEQEEVVAELVEDEEKNSETENAEAESDYAQEYEVAEVLEAEVVAENEDAQTIKTTNIKDEDAQTIETTIVEDKEIIETAETETAEAKSAEVKIEKEENENSEIETAEIEGNDISETVETETVETEIAEIKNSKIEIEKEENEITAEEEVEVSSAQNYKETLPIVALNEGTSTENKSQTIDENSEEFENEEDLHIKKKDDDSDNNEIVSENESLNDLYENNEDKEDTEVAPKQAKLAKLPLFMDYCVSQNLKHDTYIKVAKVLFMAYNIYKNSPENKDITLLCIKKLIPKLKY